MKRFLSRFVAVLIVGILGYAGFAWLWGVPSVPDRPISTDAAVIAQGQYLAYAGDCGSCHTVPGGGTLAGGLKIDTPFGEIYSTNITPSDDGIKGMTTAQFYQIMTYGADSVSRPLYPAMPYTSFHLVTRDDSDAMLAYLMSLPPVDQKAPATELSFPFNIRPLMFGWNLLFANRGPYVADAAKDATWNRGAYLVNGLGHCGACHSPRNSLGAEDADRALTGAQIGELMAPDITAAALRERGWNREYLATYFATGASPKGSAFGEMFLAVKGSLSRLTHEDLDAIATYLLDGSADEPSHGETVVASLGAAAHANSEGQALYLSNCALCHKQQGEGIADTMPPLAGNSVLLEPDGRNLLTVMANGLAPAQVAAGKTSFGPMPAFRDRLSAAQMTALANYVRSAFGGETVPPLTESEVATILSGN